MKKYLYKTCRLRSKLIDVKCGICLPNANIESAVLIVSFGGGTLEMDYKTTKNIVL